MCGISQIGDVMVRRGPGSDFYRPLQRGEGGSKKLQIEHYIMVEPSLSGIMSMYLFIR